jgi:hypothetical protein
MPTDETNDRNQKLVWLADEHELGFTRKMAAEHLRCGLEQAAYFVREALKCGVLSRVRRPPEVRYCRPERAEWLRQTLEDIQDRQLFLDPKQTTVKAAEAKSLPITRGAVSVFAWAEEMAS